MRGAFRTGTTLLLAVLLTATPLASALPGGVNVRVDRSDADVAGPLPRVCTDRSSVPPDVSVGDCGPRVVVRVTTPAGTIEEEFGCQTDCTSLIVIVVEVCAALGRGVVPFHTPPFHDSNTPIASLLLDIVEEELERGVSTAPGGSTVDYEASKDIEDAEEECSPSNVDLR